MFGRQSVQVISLDDLARFISQVIPPAQNQGATTITIYVQEMHVHMNEHATPLLNAGSYAALSAPGTQVIDTPVSAWDYAPPPQLRR